MAKRITTFLLLWNLLLAFAQNQGKTDLAHSGLKGPVAEYTYANYAIHRDSLKGDSLILIESETNQYDRAGKLTGHTKYGGAYRKKFTATYFHNGRQYEYYDCYGDRTNIFSFGPAPANYDSAGRITLKWTNHLTCDSATIDSFTYDKRGNILQHLRKEKAMENICDSSAEFKPVTINRYNDSGQIVWRKEGASTVVFKYDDAGYPLETDVYEGGSEPVNRLVYCYNAKGQLEQMDRYKAYEVEGPFIYYSYDSMGSELQQLAMHGRGFKNLYLHHYTYDTYGNWVTDSIVKDVLKHSSTFAKRDISYYHQPDVAPSTKHRRRKKTTTK